MAGLEKNTMWLQHCLRTGNHFRNQSKALYIALVHLTQPSEIRSGVSGGQSNCVLIPPNMPQKCVMKQLISNAGSLHSHLQSGAFIIPSPQIKLKQSAPWPWHHFMWTLRVDSSKNSMSLVRFTGHLKAFWWFSAPVRSQVQPPGFVPPKRLSLTWSWVAQKLRSMFHTRQNPPWCKVTKDHASNMQLD